MSETIEKRIKELRELKQNSTQVVKWYPHHDSVRGPFCRWFKVTEVSEKDKKHVAYAGDDAKYAAAAMNELPALLDSLEIALQAMKDAEFVLEGSQAVEGQSDEILGKRERALQRFLEAINKIKARLGGE